MILNKIKARVCKKISFNMQTMKKMRMTKIFYTIYKNIKINN